MYLFFLISLAQKKQNNCSNNSVHADTLLTKVDHLWTFLHILLLFCHRKTQIYLEWKRTVLFQLLVHTYLIFLFRMITIGTQGIITVILMYKRLDYFFTSLKRLYFQTIRFLYTCRTKDEHLRSLQNLDYYFKPAHFVPPQNALKKKNILRLHNLWSYFS